MPITHEWNGTILTITSDSGTSSCDLKGEKGDDGARGAQGKPGDCVATDTAMLGGVAAAEYATKSYVEAAVEGLEPPEIDLTDYALKTDLEGLATNQYVNDVVSTIDLTDYATKQYVNDAVSNLDIPDTDLSNYYTKTETDTAINNAKPDLTKYALKTDTATDSEKLGGKMPDDYMKIENVLTLEEISATTILDDKTVCANDFKKTYPEITYISCENISTNVMKFANIVFITASILTTKEMIANEWENILKINADYAPLNDMIFSTIASGTTICQFNIDTSGNVRVMPRQQISTNSGISFMCVYAR